MTIGALTVGQSASIELDVTADLIDRFAALSTDDNPLHVDTAYARAAGFADRVAHGALSIAALSALIGTRLPGAGALWRRLQVDWVCPLFPGDRVTIQIQVVQASSAQQSVVLRVHGRNQNHVDVLRGEAIVGVIEERPAGPSPDMPASAHTVNPAPTADAAAGAAGRAVLVTGGSRGMGRAIAIGLAALGHPVAVGYHQRRQEADLVVNEIAGKGGRAAAIPLDLERDEGLLEGVDAASARLGPIVGLVHGATPPLTQATLAELSRSDLERYWRVYVGSLLGGLQRLQRHIQEARWGRLVFLGTSAQLGAPPPRMLAYVSAKAALDGLMRALAVELGPLGATVNMIAPGLVKTDLTRHVTARAALAEAQRTPLRRLAEPDDAAAVVSFLFGDSAGFITGICLPLTGGLVMS